MMKRMISILLVLLQFTGMLRAQDVLEVKRVDLDGLVSYIRQATGHPVYYIREAEDQNSFTISAPRASFLEAVEKDLLDQGYKVSHYDGAMYILRTQTISDNLPAGFFDERLTTRDDSELQKYLEAQNTVATFQNKVYEIGERDSGRTGKVFVSGHIRDVSSGEPLVGVAVYDDANAYTITDDAGFYRIQLPVGETYLNYSGYSLEDMRLSLRIYDSGGLDVVMKEKVTALTGAVVSADQISNHRDAHMGLEKVRMNVASKVPTAFGEADVLKVVLTLPGVKSVGEASSGFNVRGGSIDQNLILLNDGTVYNPAHMFGLFSAFNPDVINDIELYKSSIPAEFGGRISSVLDVRGREGNSNKLTGSLGLGLLTSRFHMEGPIWKGRTNFIVGGRTTYSNWLMKLLPAKSAYSGGKASFRDLNASITHKFSDKNNIKASFYTSADGFSFSEDTTFRYANTNASLRWHSTFSEKHDMVAVVGYDSYRGGFNDTFNTWSAYSVTTGIRQGYGKLTFHSSLADDRHNLTYGLQSTYYDLNPGQLRPILLDEYAYVEARDLPVERAVESAVYLSDSWTPSRSLAFDLGLRYVTFVALDPSKFYHAPEFRISGKYSFIENLSFKAGFNTMNQYMHLITNTASVSPVDAWQLSGADFKPQTGWQAAGGLYWTVADGKVDISAETYYKHSSNTLDYKSGAKIIMNENLAQDVVTTYGKAYGIELMARKAIGKLNGWVSYTYSRTFLREMEDRGAETINGGDWYRAPHDKPHDFKIVGNYKFTHRYSMSVNVDYSTGRPVTVPIGWYYYGGGRRLAYSARNAYRIPDYFRMDLAMNVEAGHYLRQLTHMSFTFGVYNVTGRKNAYSVFYTTSGGGKITGHKLSVFACPIPYINLNLKF